jgi:hypothetical protein
MIIGLRSKHIDSREYFIPKGQSNPDACNQMRRMSNGNIEVRTLYRFGKPSTVEYTNEQFDSWQSKLDKHHYEMNTYEDITK